MPLRRWAGIGEAGVSFYFHTEVQAQIVENLSCQIFKLKSILSGNNLNFIP